MSFYTMVLRKSGAYWVAVCLENGLVGQGDTKDAAIKKLKGAVESFEEEYKKDTDIFNAPIPIKELHEFLTVEGKEPVSEEYELRLMHA
ncbi:type II toxin-antitoxin system HicB family antitoxin [Desulfoglaeba alkanexedens]|uniref:Type II toxin-antitoxin system HicB family antitoxin n=1 Tax=Desulfoglaeba alkanexedens ALDC TaxID=980445 RepID=A0A4V1ERE2_9BACT|nr:type II toxin-antitoxin system HicB family antitoxin [Desulfoglaeba alkanexedens]QCQ21331.1 type II toxin-antitoxin system HicB family antitoxin [Desulfoglaeba alkanexedens ALDC]